MARVNAEKKERKFIARELYILYCDAIRSALPSRSVTKPPVKLECKDCGRWFLANSQTNKLCEKCRKQKAANARSFELLGKSDRRAFMAAARVCIEVEADTKDFIVAQFAMWREASAYHKKLLVPAPHHLGTYAAHVRYLLHQARQEVRLSRVMEIEDQDERRRWYVEERHLSGLARIQRRDPLEVLTEQPEQFSRDFLKHKGVWSVVQDLWEDRKNS